MSHFGLWGGWLFWVASKFGERDIWGGLINLPPCVEEGYGKWRTEQSGSCKQHRALDHGLYRNVFAAGPSSTGLPPHRIASRTWAGHASSHREHCWKTWSRCDRAITLCSFKQIFKICQMSLRNFVGTSTAISFLSESIWKKTTTRIHTRWRVNMGRLWCTM
jgi:hypothetical protein